MILDHFLSSSTTRPASKRIDELESERTRSIPTENYMKFGKDYFDNPDLGLGYGGYIYDGRYRDAAIRIALHYGLKKGDKILEIGCAKGFILKEFFDLGFEVRGIDVSMYAVENAHPDVAKFITCSSSDKLPFEDKSFSFVFAKDVLPHVPEDKVRNVIEECIRVSKGPVFFDIQCGRTKEELDYLIKWDPTTKIPKTPKQWEKLFKECGYSGDVHFKILFPEKSIAGKGGKAKKYALEGTSKTAPFRVRMSELAKRFQAVIEPRFPFAFRILRAVYRLFYPLFSRTAAALALAYLSSEYFILLLFHCFRLRGIEFVCPRWYWTFGHQALETHMLAFRFRGKKLLILLSDYGGYNKYLIDSFRPIVEICDLKHSRLAGLIRRSFFDDRDRMKLYSAKWKIAKLFLFLVGNREARIVETFHTPSKSQFDYAVEYVNLLKENDDVQVSPPKEAIAEFRSLMLKEHPELDGKWLVSLYLRKKGDVRDTMPEPYRAMLERIVELGGAVLCGGDYDIHEIFPVLKGVYGYDDFSCERELADIFFLTQCEFLICGHSAPVSIAAVFRVPTLVSNCPFFDHSAFREEQFVLYKSIRDKKTGKMLCCNELFSPPIIDYRGKFLREDIDVIDSTVNKLLKAGNEMIERFHFKRYEETSEEKGMIEAFRSLVPSGAWVRETPSKPVSSSLKNIVGQYYAANIKKDFSAVNPFRKPRTVILGEKPQGSQWLQIVIDCGLFDIIAGTPCFERKRWWGEDAFHDILEDNGIPVLRRSDLTELNFDILFSFVYPFVIEKELVEKPSMYAVNLHESPLPKYRGCNGYSHAILEGARQYGTTLHTMTGELDAGKLIDQELFDIDPNETALELYSRTKDYSTALLKRNLENFAEGNIALKPMETSSEAVNPRSSLDKFREISAATLLNPQEFYKAVRALDFPPFEPVFLAINGKKYYAFIDGSAGRSKWNGTKTESAEFSFNLLSKGMPLLITSFARPVLVMEEKMYRSCFQVFSSKNQL